MRDNKYLAWASFVLFDLNIAIILVMVLFSSALQNMSENPGVLILVIGAFSLLGMVMGLLSFKAPQAKVGGIGGLVLLLIVLFVIPVGRETVITPPQAEVRRQDQARQTGIAEIDTIIDTVLGGNPQEELPLLQFSTLACTHAEGLGGPPKCRPGELEGTEIEAFPFLGAEGGHLRRSEMQDWAGIQVSGVYAVYRVSEQVYSDEAYPAGEYAIVFLVENNDYLITAQVRDGKIVRLDTNYGEPAEIDLERLASEVILAPQR
jgi:hypothetical protein